MKKIIALIVIALLLASFGGGYWYWNKQADNAEAMVSAHIKELNQWAKQQYDPAVLTTDMLTYKNITRSGFPFNMALSIVDPVLTVPMAVDSPNTWVDTYAMDGEFKITSSFDRASWSTTLTGTQTATSTINGKPEFVRVTTFGNPMHCDFRIDPAKAEQLMAEAKSEQEVAVDQLSSGFQALERLDCDISKLKTITPESDEKIFSLKSMNVVYDGPQQENNSKFDLKFKAEDAQWYPAIQSYLDRVVELRENQRVPFRIDTVPFAALGEQDIAFELKYDGPKDVADMEKLTDLHVVIPTLSLNNNLFTTTSSVEFHHVLEGPLRQVRFESDSKFKAAEGFDDYYRNRALQVIESARKQPGSRPFGHNVASWDPQQARAFAEEISPGLIDEGEIQSSIKLKGHLPSGQGDEPVLDFGASLEELIIKSDNWSLNGNMKGQATAQSPMPTATGKLVCENCGKMIDTLGSFIRNRISFNNVYQSPPVRITQPMLDDIKRALTLVAQGKTQPQPVETNPTETLNYELNFNNLSLMINGMPYQQVMVMLGQYLAPHLQGVGQPGHMQGGIENQGIPNSSGVPQPAQ